MPNTRFVREVGAHRWAWRWTRRQIAKRILRRPSLVRLPTGLVFTAPTSSRFGSEVIYTRANVDGGSERLFSTFARRDEDFLDVGAHIGYYSLYLAPLVRHVYAFEPDPRNSENLRDNLPPNATCVPAAVSSRSGVARLDQSRESGQISDHGISVTTTTIDEFVARTPGIVPRLMKLDIEGHETAALAGAAKAIHRWQPLILTEFSSGHGNSPVALADFLGQHNYAAYAYVKRSDQRRPPPLDLDDLERLPSPVKMIFLVPQRFRGGFE